jgi:hypothetical protein
MSTEMPVTFAGDVTETTVEVEQGTSKWIETAVAVLFTATAVVFVSFVAVMIGLG